MTRGWQHWAFLSTPSARRATDALPRLSAEWIQISIHALREEGDADAVQYKVWSISFLSTPSARRATVGLLLHQRCSPIFLSTPSARRATCSPMKKANAEGISIHALREEGDAVRTACALLFWRFLSTPSARRATVRLHYRSGSGTSNFYPRPPRGGRRPDRPSHASLFDFYPRPPRGGRPRLLHELLAVTDISIHALREEGDPRKSAQGYHDDAHFYPRPPRGGRPPFC